MSFSTDTKNELARLHPEKKCCMLAEIAGFIRMCGSMRLAGGGKVKLAITTDNAATARHFKVLLKEYFSVEAELGVEGSSGMRRGRTFLLTIRIRESDVSEQILRETGILLVREGMNAISDGIYEGLIKTKCCRKAYLRGVFLGAGVLTHPEKAYHIEFLCTTRALAADVKRLINSFAGLHAKVVERKRLHVVYVKDSEQIVDILNLMGAHGQLFAFENMRIVKEMRNKTNRINNCDSANLDKMLNASGRHLDNIRRIRETVGLEALPQKLREVAMLRMEHPEASLAELAEMTDPPMKKSGINKRMMKIQELADKLE